MFRCIIGSCIVLAFLLADQSFAQTSLSSPLPSQWLPKTTVVYAQSAKAETFEKLPIAKQLIGSTVFQEIWRSPEVMKVRGGMTIAELALGERLPQVVRKLTAHGLAVAVDAKSKGVVMMSHAQDAATCAGLYKKLVDLARSDAKSKGNPGRVKSASYRGLEGYQIDEAIVVAMDDWLLVTNKGELAKTIIDNKIDGTKDSLWESIEYQAAANSQPMNSLAWAFVDIAQLRTVGAAKDLFKRPNENFVAELLVGGLLASVREATTACATLVAEESVLKWTLRAQNTKALQLPEYEYSLGSKGNGFSPQQIAAPGRLLCVSAYRDVAQLWRGAGDLFGARTNDQLAQAEATLTTLFSGRDFGQDILGAIEPGLQLIVVEQDFSKAPFKPKIQLPAFALVTKLRNPAIMQSQLKRIFSSLIGFLNITGAQNQQPQLDLESVKEGSDIYVMATYSPDVDRPSDWTVPIHYNFSPTLAMSGDYAILGSTGAIARTIVEHVKDSSVVNSGADQKFNTRVSLNGGLIVSALSANRSQLVSQNMLEKGHSREEAESEIAMLFKILGFVQSLDIGFHVVDHEDAALDFQLKLNLP